MDTNIESIQAIADHDITKIEELDLGRIKIITDNEIELIIVVLSMSNLEERISELDKKVSELQLTIEDMETKKAELEAMVVPTSEIPL